MVCGMTHHRIGIDLGGTKIEIAVLRPDGTETLRHRIPTPHGYPETLDALTGLVRDAEAQLGVTATVGMRWRRVSVPSGRSTAISILVPPRSMPMR